MSSRTMARISYGFGAPEDLFEKFKREGAKLGERPEPDDIFNFLVTGASLNEWVKTSLRGDPLIDEVAASLRPGGKWQHLPEQTSNWITDNSCVPNKHCDVRRHIHNSLCICWDAAGASKHFHWKGSKVRGISSKPIVRSWYQYFFTSVTPDLYIDYGGETYGLRQIRGILNQFYERLFTYARGPRDAT